MSRLVAILFAVAACLCAYAQEAATGLTAEKCFSSMPEGVLDLLSANTRLDMLDYFKAGTQHQSRNELDGPAKIISCSPRSISFQYSESDTVQLFVLNPDSKPLIGIIHTLATPISDSTIKLYSSTWEEAKVQAPVPTLSQWLKKGATAADRAKVENALPYILATAAYDPDTKTLTFTNSMQAFFFQGEGDDVMALLRPEIRFAWNGSKFTLLK